MTTIAYRDGIIASDSRIIRGDLIITDYSTDKIQRRDTLVFFLSGAISDFDYFIDCFLANKQPKRSVDTVAIVFDEEHSELWHSAVDNRYRDLWRCRLDKNTYTAIGSGTGHALTAMDCGRSAVEAVALAARRDPNTGGMINTYDINNPEAGVLAG